MKAYTTRVGEGPLPTECPAVSDMLHAMGREFGATTGRARRCGWFDAVATRYARLVNGIDELAITNLDGLDTLGELKICVAYESRGKRIQFPPNDAEELLHCRPVYRKFPGWKKPTSGVRHFKKSAPRRPELPQGIGRADRRPAQHRFGRRPARRDLLGLGARGAAES